jgi:hypothetical protein
MLFPKVVCVSISDGARKDLFLAPLGVQEIISLLRDPNVVLIGHNVAFDLGCIVAEAIDTGFDAHEIVSLVFQAYADDRIVDTMIRCMLVDIAQGTFQEIEGQRRGKTYGLDRLADRWLGRTIAQKTFTKKTQHQAGNSWRLHYAALDGVPLAQWPKDAYDYAIEDAEITWLVDEAITQWAIKEGLPSPGSIPDEFRQHRAAWVLHLMAGWGVHIDSEMVKEIRTELERQRAIHYLTMDRYGLFKKDQLGNFKLTKKGQRSINQKVLKQYVADGFASKGEQAPTTAGRVNKQGVRIPEVAIDADTCLASGHPAAIAYAEVSNTVKLLSTYVPALERGRGGRPVTSSPNVLVASGRTSWTGPNWQNPPKVGGIRECVIPRQGRVFVAADLDTVELRALAQACLEILGHSEMASALQRGEDLHLSLAAEILGISYAQAQALEAAGDPLVSDTRQSAKAPNFGFPGGMGAPKFAQNQIDMGTPLVKDPDAPFSAHLERSRFLREAWFKRWPEMRPYLAHAGEITGDFGSRMIEQPWSGRIRGGLDYCSCANTYFQGRVADGAKLALWRLAWACYVDKTSILYGSRLVLFLHDEVILECLEGTAHECALEIVRILCAAVQEVIPDIPITSKPVIMRRWYKGAKPVKIDNRLVPCKPEKDTSGKTKWVQDGGKSEGDQWLN